MIHSCITKWCSRALRKSCSFVSFMFGSQFVPTLFYDCFCWKLYFKLRGIAHRNHWNTRTDDSYIVYVHVEKLLLLTQFRHILFMSQCVLLLLLLPIPSLSQTLSNPIHLKISVTHLFSLLQSSFPMCHIFTTSNEPPHHRGQIHFSQKLYNWHAFRANANSTCA